MDLKSILIKEKEAILVRLEHINAIIDSYGGDGATTDSNVNANYSNQRKKVFPSKALPDKQVMWIFENAIEKGLKLKEAQQVLNEYVGNDSVLIDNRARKLKKEGKLILVKYNDKHIYSFWGLPSWVDGDDFEAKYKPDMELLPEITTSEVVRT